MRAVLTISVLLCGAASAQTPPVQGASESPSPSCKAPNALLAAGFADDAKTAYREILAGLDSLKEEERAEAERCATVGLASAHAALVTMYVAVGDLYRAAKNNDAAASQYEEALKLLPTSQAAKEGVDGLREDTVTAVERARRLSKLGQHDKALEVLNAALVSDGGLKEEVPDDLAYLYGGGVPIWDGLHRYLDPWARPVLEILTVLVLIAALVRMTAAALGVVRRRLEIEDFDKGGFEQEYFGKYFATEVRGRLQRMAKGSRRGRINLVTGPIESVELPSQIEGIGPAGTLFSPVAWVKAIPALLFWLLPRNTVKLTGFLHNAGERGAGVTVQLARNDKVVESYTFWQQDFDKERKPSEDDERDGIDPLAEYVAVWLLFHTMKYFGHELRMLGTWDWRSYALFRAGVLAMEENRREAAKSLYVQALQLDPKLRGARFNLARCLALEGDKKGALEQYEKVKYEAWRAEGGDRDPTLYSAEYNIALAAYNTEGAVAAKPLVSALLRKIETKQSLIDQNRKGYTDPALREHLARIRPVVRVTLAGLMLETGEPGGEFILDEEGRAADVSAPLQCTLACSHSLAAQAAQTPAEAKRHGQQSLVFLERAIKLEPRFADMIADDKSLAWLRKNETAAVDALVAKYGSAPAVAVDEPNPLAEYTVIGDANAQKLKKNGIKTSDELLKKTIRPADRQSLAVLLGVGTPVVTAWAHAVDLARIVGMTPAHVNLLVSAGVGTLAELGAKDPSELTELLTGIGEAIGVTDLPDPAAVHGWVDDARTNTKTKLL